MAKGNCFQDAFNYQANFRARPEDESVLLVHGAVRSGDSRTYWLPHAWVEMLGEIWEPQSNQIFDKETFMALTGAVEYAKYTRLEAIEKMFEFNHTGPWDEESELLLELNN